MVDMGIYQNFSLLSTWLYIQVFTERVVLDCTNPLPLIDKHIQITTQIGFSGLDVARLKIDNISIFLCHEAESVVIV